MIRSLEQERKVEQLWTERFASIPTDCGQGDDAGIEEIAEWRDWSEIETTSDQKRIEEVLERLGVSGRKILHIGVGNSLLAKRFSSRAAYILGTTIYESERKHGESLELSNYDVRVHNKFAESRVVGRSSTYDFIVDNNPTTFCCCWRHFIVMMRHYSELLAPSGQLLTDKVGLSWVASEPTANPRWSFTYDDWQAIGQPFDLEARKLNDFVFCLSPRSRINAAALRLKQVIKKVAWGV